MYHLTVSRKGKLFGTETLLNEIDWATDLQNLNMCRHSCSILSNILSLQWNALVFHARYHRNKLIQKINHKVSDLKHKNDAQWKRFRRTGNQLGLLRQEILYLYIEVHKFEKKI